MIRVVTPVVKWVQVADFPSYEISELGEIRTLPSKLEVPKAKFDGVEYAELWKDGKPYLQHVNRMRWAAFNHPGFPPVRTTLERHGRWDDEKMKYADGEKSHMCGFVCAVGEV
jgi:hypothetical protein